MACLLSDCVLLRAEQPSGESLIDLVSQSAEAALTIAAGISKQTPSKLGAATVYALGCVAPGELVVEVFLQGQLFSITILCNLHSAMLRFSGRPETTESFDDSCAGLGSVKRRECCSAACTVLHLSGSALLQSGRIGDVIAGMGHLLTSLQVLSLLPASTALDILHSMPQAIMSKLRLPK